MVYILFICLITLMYFFWRSLTEEQKQKIFSIIQELLNKDDRPTHPNTSFPSNDATIPDMQPMEELSARTYDIQIPMEEMFTKAHDTQIPSNLEQQKTCPFCCRTVSLEYKVCPDCNLPIPKKTPKRQKTEIIKSALGNDMPIKSIATTKRFVRPYYSPDKHSTCCSLNNFTVIDFETANMYPDSVCQMGIAIINNNIIVESKSYLIRPPYNDFRNKEIHGITLDDVKNKENFRELWETIKPYIENQLLCAYNAEFDIGCLLATLKTYKIPVPSFAYFDILQNVRSTFSQYKSEGYIDDFKLRTMTSFFNIEHNAHDALSDVIAAAKVQFECGIDECYCLMIESENSSPYAMAHLLRGRELIKVIKEIIKDENYKQIEDYQKVFQLLDQAKANGLDDAYYLRYYGEIYEKCNNNAKALEFYIRAYELNKKIGLKNKIKRLGGKFPDKVDESNPQQNEEMKSSLQDGEERS